MSDVIPTRREKALQLWAMMRDGPDYGTDQISPAEANRRFRIWSEAWAMPLITQLVRELNDGEPK